MKVNFTKSTIAIALLGSVLLFSMIPIREHEKAFHTQAELDYFLANPEFFAPPVDSSILFPTSNVCGGCHSFDPLGNAMVDADGNDVNIYDDWNATMMANSAKDPFWRAKVSHEILVNPNHSLDLQTKCTSCHAPNGHYTAILRGAAHYTIDEMLADSIAMDGVTCSTCHQISAENLGSQHSGDLTFDTSRVAYGPYEMPFTAPMKNFVGFVPKYSEHVNDAGMCASCHTLITKSVDLNGDFTGSTFVEQATYHEWLNSTYNGTSPINSTSCQSCHMPRIDDTVVIASNLLFLAGRTPYALHDLVGANTFMLQLMKENKEALDILASDENYDETIAKTLAMLQQQSIDMELDVEYIHPDTAAFSVFIKNKAGHKFPSGYPSRRAFVEFVVTSELGDTLFQSGVLQPDFEVAGQDPESEPHYDIIRDEEQVQIYELVLGDVNGNFTTVLERSFAALKDNRLPPVGFTTTHEVYDTTQVIGNALLDADFNKDDTGTEGSGADVVHYHFPIDGYEGLIHISAKIFYQSLPPKWMEEMFAESTPEIDSFKNMYYATDQTPVLIASQNLDSIYVNPIATEEVRQSIDLNIYPNPTTDGWVFISKNKTVNIRQIKIFDLHGKLLRIVNSDFEKIQLPNFSNIYFIEIQTDRGSVLKKIVRN